MTKHASQQAAGWWVVVVFTFLKAPLEDTGKEQNLTAVLQRSLESRALSKRNQARTHVATPLRIQMSLGRALGFIAESPPHSYVV